jgi:aryl-alcohol dehydrogenase-like predicted oxidoreductase
MININPQKLILGTVKFGIPNYGLTHDNNFVDDISNFLLESHKIGVVNLDTAERYGNSESLIGSFLKKYKLDFKISTKIDNLENKGKESLNIIKKSINLSIQKLNVEKINICYLHQNDINIITDKYIQEALLELKQNGIIEYIGASIYSIEECNAAIESNVFDYIQVPVNLVDTSIYNTCVLNYNGNIRFIARSIYLQGLLIDSLQKTKILNYQNEINDYMKDISIFSDELGLKISDLSRSFVFSLNNIDSYVIGTTSLKNLKSNLISYDFNDKMEYFNYIYSKSLTEKPWANPRNWLINS